MPEGFNITEYDLRKESGVAKRLDNATHRTYTLLAGNDEANIQHCLKFLKVSS